MFPLIPVCMKYKKILPFTFANSILLQNLCNTYKTEISDLRQEVACSMMFDRSYLTWGQDKHKNDELVDPICDIDIIIDIERDK